MRLLKNQLFPFLFFLCYWQLLSVVPKKGDTIVQTKPLFVLNISYDTDIKGKLDVEFQTNDLSVVPEVTLNNVTLTNGTLGNSVYLSGIIDSSKTVTYSVTANGKTTAGTITIPNSTEILSINNVLNNDVGYIYIPSASTYTMKWKNTGAQHYYLHYYDYSNYNPYNVYTADTSANLNLPSRTGYGTLYALNGFAFDIGATPNVTGDYGDGYVTASSYSDNVNYVYIRPSEYQLTKATEVPVNKEKNPVFDQLVKIIQK